MYLYEIMALFLEPATMASVWQLGPSGPMKAAMSLRKKHPFSFFATNSDLLYFLTCK